jgi:hypothetical protein
VFNLYENFDCRQYEAKEIKRHFETVHDECGGKTPNT